MEALASLAILNSQLSLTPLGLLIGRRDGSLMRKYVLLSLAVGLMAGAAISQAVQQRVVQSEVFEVVDQSGQLRAKLGTTADGRVVLQLYDSSGEVIWEAPTRARVVPLHDKTSQIRCNVSSR